MALLHDLVLHLDKERIDQLSGLSLSSREQEVLSFVISQRRSVFPTALALKKLGLSQSHFDKLASVVLKKILLHFAGADPVKQLEFLRTVPGAPRNLLRQQMKSCLKLNLSEAHQLQLLQYCFKTVTHFAVTDLNEKEIDFYQKQLLAHTSFGSNPLARLRVKADSLHAMVNMAGGTMTISHATVQASLNQRADELVREAEQIDSTQALYCGYMAAGYYYQVANRLQEFLAKQEQALALVKVRAEDFSSSEIREAQLMYATALAMVDRFEESYQEFLPFLPQCRYEQADVQLGMQTRFFKVALTAGYYNTARQLLHNTYATALNRSIVAHRVMACLQYMCYYLHTGELKEVPVYLEKAKEAMHKNKLLQYEVQLRYLENAYTFLGGNLEEALFMADKNIKFLRTRGLHAIDREYSYFFTAIKGIYRYVTSGDALNAKQAQAYDLYFHASWSHLGKLLQKMMAMKKGS